MKLIKYYNFRVKFRNITKDDEVFVNIFFSLCHVMFLEVSPITLDKSEALFPSLSEQDELRCSSVESSEVSIGSGSPGTDTITVRIIYEFIDTFLEIFSRSTTILKNYFERKGFAYN